MHAFEYQDGLKISESDNSNIAIQELDDEAESLQQLSGLEIKYALLNALYTQLDQREAILNSEHEVVRMTGKRQIPRKAKNR